GLVPARPGAGGLAVARAVRVARAGVEPEPGDHRVGVAAVGVDRDPLALALPTPAHEAAGVERALQQVAADQGVRDAAGAVVAAVLDRGMPAAVPVRLLDDVVGRLDRALDAARGVPRRDRETVHDLRLLGRLVLG